MKQQLNKSAVSNYLPYLWLLIGAVLYVFTVGIHIIPVAVWIAPVFIIRFSRSQNVAKGSLIILFTIIITQAIAYLRTFPVSGIYGIICYVIGIATGILIVIPYIADRIISKRYDSILTTLVFPAVMLCILYLYSCIPIVGSSFIGFFQYGLLPLQKILSISGFNSFLFLTLWFASLLNWCWERKFIWREVKKPVCIYLTILSLGLIFGGAKNIFYPDQNSKFVFNPNSEYWPTKDWKISTPERQGMDSGLLAEMYKKINDEKAEILSLIVVRNGYIIAEANKNKNITYPMHSTTKSYASAVLGIAIDKGFIKSIDQKVTEFFPEYMQGKSEITLRHLLTMSSGLEWPEAYIDYSEILDNPYSRMMTTSSNWVEFILSKPLVLKPGSVFNYNSGCSHLLMAVLYRTGLKDVENFIQESLFTPLGIISGFQYIWEKDPNGILNGCCGLHMTPRAMAKFGYLFLKGGYWDGKQIISKK